MTGFISSSQKTHYTTNCLMPISGALLLSFENPVSNICIATQCCIYKLKKCPILRSEAHTIHFLGLQVGDRWVSEESLIDSGPLRRQLAGQAEAAGCPEGVCGPAEGGQGANGGHWGRFDRPHHHPSIPTACSRGVHLYPLHWQKP